MNCKTCAHWNQKGLENGGGICESRKLRENLYGGRLTWDGDKLDYCTGQYYPVEYRKAICRALASAIWTYFREDCGCNTREKILAAAKRAFRSRRILNYF